MSWDLYVRAFLYLLLVLGLIFTCTWLLRFYGGGRLAIRGSKRIQIVEAMAIDPRRRLIAIRWDDQEHLILLSANRDLVVSSKSAADSFTAQLPKDEP